MRRDIFGDSELPREVGKGTQTPGEQEKGGASETPTAEGDNQAPPTITNPLFRSGKPHTHLSR